MADGCLQSQGWGQLLNKTPRGYLLRVTGAYHGPIPRLSLWRAGCRLQGGLCSEPLLWRDHDHAVMGGKE